MYIYFFPKQKIVENYKKVKYLGEFFWTCNTPGGENWRKEKKNTIIKYNFTHFSQTEKVNKLSKYLKHWWISLWRYPRWRRQREKERGREKIYCGNMQERKVGTLQLRGKSILPPPWLESALCPPSAPSPMPCWFSLSKARGGNTLLFPQRKKSVLFSNFQDVNMGSCFFPTRDFFWGETRCGSFPPCFFYILVAVTPATFR